MPPNSRYNKTRYAGSTPQDFHFIDGKNREIGRSEQCGNTTWAEVMDWFSIVYPDLEPGAFNVHQCSETDPRDPLRKHGRAIDLTAAGHHLILPNTWYVILGQNAPRIPPFPAMYKDTRVC
ncbi:hypothetical protein ABW21_db0209912 [Orbilia brochopaga]|nr:hypothetical protein ABW21_db0209912 [Drechslerella brochopaga]